MRRRHHRGARRRSSTPGPMDRILEFTINHTLLVSALVVSFFVLVFSELRRKATAVSAVDPTAAVALINNDATVLDVRSAEAYGRGHIVKARNIPMDELSAKITRLETLKDKPIVAVCDSGMTSNRVIATLKNAGFDSVYNLKGGMAAWSQAGMPVVSGKKTKSKG